MRKQTAIGVVLAGLLIAGCGTTETDQEPSPDDGPPATTTTGAGPTNVSVDVPVDTIELADLLDELDHAVADLDDTLNDEDGDPLDE
jgi:hypothetical protein